MNIGTIVSAVQWVVVIFAAVGIMKNVMSKNIAGVVVSVLVAAVGIFFIAKPDFFVNFGRDWGTSIGGMFN